MTLPELCEPLFEYYCRLNRSAEAGLSGSYDYDHARRDIDGIFRTMQQKADSETGLHVQYEKIKLVLIYFIDSMISSSKLPFREEWHKKRIAFESGHTGGDEDFFYELQDTLGDHSSAANERLVIFHTCLGLGFKGDFYDQPDTIREYKMQCAARVADMMDVNEMAKLTPDAYYADKTPLAPPVRRLAWLGAVFAVAVVLVFVFNMLFFTWSSHDITNACSNILSAQETGSAASDSPEEK